MGGRSLTTCVWLRAQTPWSRGTALGTCPSPKTLCVASANFFLWGQAFCVETALNQHSRPEKHHILEPQEAQRSPSQPLRFMDSTPNPERLSDSWEVPQRAGGGRFAWEKGPCAGESTSVIGARVPHGNLEPYDARRTRWGGHTAPAGLATVCHPRQPWDPGGSEEYSVS